jgi:ribosome-binding factor A
MYRSIIQSKSKGSGQRPAKVAQEIRRILAQAFLEDDLLIGSFPGVSVTVSSVDVAPDMRQARVYVLPLGREVTKDFEAVLEECAQECTRIVAHALKIKFTPKIVLKADYGFDKAARMDSLIKAAVAETGKEGGEEGTDSR